MFEEACAFIETSFDSKLKKTDRTLQAEKYGVPDSRWLKCLELDPVVSSTTVRKKTLAIKNFGEFGESITIRQSF